MKTERHLKLVAEPLWKRALRNRNHWDNHQLVVDAFELSRKLEVDRRIDDDERITAIKAREASKQAQIKREKPLRVNTPPIAPLPISNAPPCPKCGGEMVFKPGCVKAMHRSQTCNRDSLTIVPYYRQRVTPQRCKTPKCPKPAASETGLCALCASRARRAVVEPSTTADASPEKNPAAGGSINGS